MIFQFFRRLSCLVHELFSRVCVSAYQVSVLDANTHKVVRRFKGHKNRITDMVRDA